MFKSKSERKHADLILQALHLAVTLACAHDYMSACLLQANASAKDKPGVLFGVCSCVASGFKEILVRDWEFSRKCKRETQVLTFPEHPWVFLVLDTLLPAMSGTPVQLFCRSSGG